MRFDHFVLNIESSYQKDQQVIDQIREAGFPYEPKCGKGTGGFKASNLWIGEQYLEMIHLLKVDGGGWKSEWVEKYHQGHRGLICLMLDMDDLDSIYQTLTQEKILMTEPECLQFKWFLNLMTKTMPWRNSYLPFWEGIPMQIGFQQMKDEKSREFMTQYMVPNSRDSGISGINKVVINGQLTKADKILLEAIFKENIINNSPLTIKLNAEQVIVFKENDHYAVDIYTKCNQAELINKELKIENVTIHNVQG